MKPKLKPASAHVCPQVALNPALNFHILIGMTTGTEQVSVKPVGGGGTQGLLLEGPSLAEVILA